MNLPNGIISFQDKDGNTVELGKADIDITLVAPEGHEPVLKSDLLQSEISLNCEMQVSELDANRLLYSSPEDSIFDSEIIG